MSAHPAALVLRTLADAPSPIKTGVVAERSGVDAREVEDLLISLMAVGLVVEPKMGKWAVGEPFGPKDAGRSVLRLLIAALTSTEEPPTALPVPRALLTSTEAAAMMGVSPSTLRLWSASGFVPHVKTTGGDRRYRFADAAEFSTSPDRVPPLKRAHRRSL